MRIHQETLQIETHGPGCVDITRALEAVVVRSKLRAGLLSLFIQHTSASLLIQENADGAVLRDLERWLSELVPRSRPWEHDEEGPDDMPAHARSALLRTSEQVPVRDGRLVLGTWQAVYCVEHRDRGRTRNLFVQLLGE